MTFPSSRLRGGLLAALLAGLLAACGGGDGPAPQDKAATSTDAATNAPAGAPGADPDFSTQGLQALAKTTAIDCPSYTSVDFKALGVSCYSSDVPENYKQPNGTRIKVLTMVKHTGAAQPKGSVYLLDGGPGGNGLAYLTRTSGNKGFPLTDELLADGWDVIVPGHRGTHSSALSCPKAEKAQLALSDPKGQCPQDGSPPSLECQALEKTAKSCLKELIEIKGGGSQGALAASQYDTVNAVRDLVAAQPVVQRAVAPVTTVLGVSYGTYWAQRLAQLHPAAASRVVLDSSMNMLGRVEEIDPHIATLLEDTLADCQANADCKTRLGTDSPKALIAKAMERLSSGQCGATLPSFGDASVSNATKWRMTNYPLMLQAMLSRPESRPIVPYMVKIAADCNQARVQELLAHDKAAREKAAKAARDEQTLPLAESPLNNVLYQTVLFSELVNAKDKKTQENIDRVASASKDTVFPGGQAEQLQRDLESAIDMVFNAVNRVFGTIKAKLLVLSARVDVQTPRQVSDEMEAAMKQAGLTPERYDAVYAGHGVVGQACARQRTLLFLNGRDGTSFNCTEPTIDWSFAREETRTVAQEGTGRELPWNGY